MAATISSVVVVAALGVVAVFALALVVALLRVTRHRQADAPGTETIRRADDGD